MLRSILYVSDSLLVFSEKQSGIEALVDYARRWNASVGITGALVFTERHFVQFIEGPEHAMGDLVANLKRDKRHTRIRFIQDINPTERYFDQWSLAYAGPDYFIDRDLSPLLFNQLDPVDPTIAQQLRSRLRAMAEI